MSSPLSPTQVTTLMELLEEEVARGLNGSGHVMHVAQQRIENLSPLLPLAQRQSIRSKTRFAISQHTLRKRAS